MTDWTRWFSMSRPILSAFLALFFFAAGSVEAAEPPEPPSMLFGPPGSETVWRVWADGRLDLVFPSRPGDTASPVVSPNQRYVAYARAGDLWLFDVGTGKRIQLTRVARPYTSKLASVEAILVSWSYDSSRILYRVAAGETDDPEGGPSRQQRKAAYGHYLMDVSAAKSRVVEPPDDLPFLKWLRDDGLAFKSGGRVLIWRLTDGSRSFLTGVDAVGWQSDLSPDGSKLALFLMPLMPTGRGTQLVTVDVGAEDNRVTPDKGYELIVRNVDGTRDTARYVVHGDNATRLAQGR